MLFFIPKYIPGTANLILTVPHDGFIKLKKCPIRQDGCLDEAGLCKYDSSADCERFNIP